MCTFKLKKKIKKKKVHEILPDGSQFEVKNI